MPDQSSLTASPADLARIRGLPASMRPSRGRRPAEIEKERARLAIRSLVANPTPDGELGYVAAEYVWTHLPEPEACLYRVESGLAGTDIDRVVSWCRFGNRGIVADNDPEEQEKVIKFGTLLANCVIFHTVVDMTTVIRELIGEGWQITGEDLAVLSPYLTAHIQRSASTPPTRSPSHRTPTTRTSASNWPPRRRPCRKPDEAVRWRTCCLRRASMADSGWLPRQVLHSGSVPSGGQIVEYP